MVEVDSDTLDAADALGSVDLGDVDDVEAMPDPAQGDGAGVGLDVEDWQEIAHKLHSQVAREAGRFDDAFRFDDDELQTTGKLLGGTIHRHTNATTSPGEAFDVLTVLYVLISWGTKAFRYWMKQQNDPAPAQANPQEDRAQPAPIGRTPPENG